MYALTNQQMRDADKYTIEKLGVPSLGLMERAGKALADVAMEMSPKREIVCVCGGGNNGGDGFVCARYLKEQGRNVKVVLLAEKFSQDCQTNKEKWQEIGGEISTDLDIQMQDSSLIIDCLFGTGFHGKAENEYARAIEWMNSLKANGVQILSADIPSGVNGDNGLAEGVAVRADKTLCIGEIKTGCLLADGIDYAGVLQRADIGISLLSDMEYATVSNRENVAKLLPERKRNSHKGTYGKAAIVAGSLEYTGAAYLSAAACLRAGAGYTTLFAPREILPYYILKMPEVLLQPICGGTNFQFKEENMQTLLDYDAIAYGMGMGNTAETAKGVKYLLERYTGKLILDADALNSLAEYQNVDMHTLFHNKKCDVLITPHVKEFSRLSKENIVDIIQKGINAPCEFAKKYDVKVLLKNAVSILTDGNQISLNATGTSGQAKAGSGDMLSGVIAGLCAAGLSVYNGAQAAAYIVGRAAQFAEKDLGAYSMNPSDVIAYIGKAFLEVLADRE